MPKVYQLGKILRDWDNRVSGNYMSCETKLGEPYWIPARSIELPNFRKRVAIAWAVFTGKLDAIDSRR